MKKIFTTLFAAAALVLGVQAQEAQNLKIHFANGTTSAYSVASIDSITFEESTVSNVTFDIQVSDITATTATVTVAATPDDAPFYFDVIEADLVAYYGATYIAEVLLEQMVELWEGQYKEMYEGYGYTFADLFLSAGTDSYTYEGNTALDPSTEYAVVAFAVDPTTLTVAGTPGTATFTTLEKQVSSEPLTITFAEADGVLTITPSNDNDYLWVEFTPEEIEGFGSAEAAWQDYVDFALSMDYLSYFITSGEDEVICANWFDPGTWTIIAAGVDVATGERTSDIYTCTVTVSEEDVAGGAARIKAKINRAIKAQQPKATIKPMKALTKEFSLK